MRECRILVEGNSSDGFSFMPVMLIEEEGNSCCPAKKDIDSLPTSFANKEAIIEFANMLIEACEKPNICKTHTIKECW